MRFLCDQDVYGITVDRLLELGHDVVTVKEVGLTDASDRLVLQRAHTERRILITRDKDFGQLVFLRRRPTYRRGSA